MQHNKRRTHYFIALPLSNEMREWMNQYRGVVKEQFLFKKWVHKEDLHITLVFLGFVEQKQLLRLQNKLRSVIQNIHSFTLVPKALGVFGRDTEPRIFWLGVEESQFLNQLQKGVRLACESEGIELDKRPYRPHITIARRWNHSIPFSLEDANQQLKLTENVNDWEINKVILYQSHLGQTPMYEEREIFHLKREE